MDFLVVLNTQEFKENWEIVSEIPLKAKTMSIQGALKCAFAFKAILQGAVCTQPRRRVSQWNLPTSENSGDSFTVHKQP